MSQVQINIKCTTPPMPCVRYEVVDNHRVYPFENQSQAIDFAKFWKGVYEVVYYSTRSREVIHRKQF